MTAQVIDFKKALNIKISKKYESESAQKVARQTSQTGSFEVGATYTTRSICDGDIVFEYKVLARTKSFVTLERHGKAIGKKKVYMYDGRECCKPQGDYSMCPVLRS
jgi:hypothetical protein